MGQVKILGSAFAVPGEKNENTHLSLINDDKVILIDSASNPIQHLQRGGIELDKITDIILTHFHPDHVSGIPLLLMGMWLMGRKKPLFLHGLSHTLDRMRTVMSLYEWGTWPNFYPVHFHSVEENEMSLVLEDKYVRIYASPVKHLIPTIGIRVERVDNSCSMAYSCDTEPCDQVVRLAKDVDFLIHESAGASLGHSSPVQAAEDAVRAGAKSLYLIHYPTNEQIQANFLADARKVFKGPVNLATDFLTLEFG
jgi:ribonuclease Z